MANLNVTCIPKNPELLWLQGPENQHRSYSLFTQGVENPLKARRCAPGLSNHIKSNGIEENVFRHIRNAGFEGVFKAGMHKIDHQLIIALVERWRPETHTFHFPIGEATVTLQDVQVLWGLPIDGPVVSGTWDIMDSESWIDTCNAYLGFAPQEEEELNDGKIKISTLVEHLSDKFADNADAYLQRARTYILAMFASQLFVDSSYHDVSLNYLENLDDLSREGRKSWGSAVIAYLYRNLCNATKPHTKGIQGPLLLLQLWAWERMPHIAPRIVHGDMLPYDNQDCYAARWNFSLSHTDTPAHVRGTYRSTFTALTNEQFRWTPYDEVLNQLPEYCRECQHIWAYSGCVVFWSTVEQHLAHRVARQFGYLQAIPAPIGLWTPQEHNEVHRIKRVGSRNTDWVQKLVRYVDIWNNRHNRVFQVVQEGGVTTTVDYMQWYYDHTVLCVTNPGKRGPSNQYPSWGAETQLYREGMREIADRAQQLMGKEPTQSQVLQEFVNLPRQIMQYACYPERMNYSSQSFEFPPGGAYYSGHTGGAYYPGHTGGAYPSMGTQWAGASSSGNLSIFRNPSPNMGFMTPSPSTPWNLSNAFTPDFNMDPNHQHFHIGRQTANVTPVPMRDFSAPSSSRTQVTNLGLPIIAEAAENDSSQQSPPPTAQATSSQSLPPVAPSVLPAEPLSPPRTDSVELQVSSPQRGTICLQGYNVKQSVAPILEAIFKKYGDIAAECMFKTASARSHFLEVVCEVVMRIETDDVIEKMEEVEGQVSDAEAANINVSWLRAHLEAVRKRKEAIKRSDLLMETKVNTSLVKRAAQVDLRERCEELMAAQERFEKAERCARVLHLVEKNIKDTILETNAENDLWVKHPVL